MRFFIASLVSGVAALTQPALAGEKIVYEVGGETFEGYLAEATREPKGLVIVIHDWDGLDEYEMTRAEMLADEGYDAFALDLYGKDNRPDTTEGKKELVGLLYNDRELMRSRILGSLAIAEEATGLSKSVVMGYCFGGGATLELARSGEGEDVVGYATFHGSLATPEGQDYSKASAPILIMHGGADTGIPNSVAADLADQLEAAGVPYELQIYAATPHAWTVFGSDRYRADADAKSWDAFLSFLKTNLTE